MKTRHPRRLAPVDFWPDSTMSVSFRVPPEEALIEVRPAVLAVSHAASGLFYELRIEGGETFVRGVDAPSAAAVSSAEWAPASLESVLAAFASDSPVANWMRAQGVDLLKVVLRNVTVGSLVETE